MEILERILFGSTEKKQTKNVVRTCMGKSRLLSVNVVEKRKSSSLEDVKGYWQKVEFGLFSSVVVS